MVRLKHRYFLCKVIFDDKQCGHNIEPYKVLGALNKTIKYLHGDHGLACAQLSLNVKYINAYTSIVLIRIRRDHKHILASSIPFVSLLYIPALKTRVKCFLQTLHCAGTIRSCQKALIRYHRKQLKILISELTSESEKERLKKSLLSSKIDENCDSDLD